MNAIDLLVTDMQGIFGARLQSIVVYDAVTPTRSSSSSADPIHTLTLVDRVHIEDLTACAARSARWDKQQLATPLVMSQHEFARSLDAFPLEYGHIIASRRIAAGIDPFEGLSVRRDDLRRACEVQAKSHLIHLRQAYIEAAGRPKLVASLIIASVTPFRALLSSVGRLRGNPVGDDESLVREATALGLPAAIVRRILGLKSPRDLASPDVGPLFAAYLNAIEQLARHVDEWNR